MTKEQIVEIVREKAKEYRQFDPNFAISIANAILAIYEQSEESYPREFVEWYSGMEFIKIDSAFKRWKRETGNQN